MEHFDFHVAVEVCERFAADTADSTLCEMVIESATIVAILESGSKKKIVSASRRCNTRTACAPLDFSVEHPSPRLRLAEESGRYNSTFRVSLG